LIYIVYIVLVRTSQKTQAVSIKKTSHLIIFNKIMAIYRTKQLNMLCHKLNYFLMLHEVINRVIDVF